MFEWNEKEMTTESNIKSLDLTNIILRKENETYKLYNFIFDKMQKLTHCDSKTHTVIALDIY